MLADFEFALISASKCFSLPCLPTIIKSTPIIFHNWNAKITENAYRFQVCFRICTKLSLVTFSASNHQDCSWSLPSLKQKAFPQCLQILEFASKSGWLTYLSSIINAALTTSFHWTGKVSQDVYILQLCFSICIKIFLFAVASFVSNNYDCS